MELVKHRAMRVVLAGEGMLELSGGAGGWRLGHGGDTLNTAIHLARAGLHTSYLTALGTDPFSADLRARWTGEGLDTALVLTHPTRGAGLYAITTDAVGERSFTYWRGESAARALFECPGIDEASAAVRKADMLAFSLISLAILPESGRERLLGLARAVRAAGGRVAFDGNYRPRLWASHDQAAGWRDRAIAVADIGLPTLEDEVLLGCAADPDAVRAHWQSLGCAETIVKLGPEGCRLPDGTSLAPEALLQPVDTSGAGDAFNAGYLAARLRGKPPTDAARSGHALAGWTIMRPGAIPPADS